MNCKKIKNRILDLEDLSGDFLNLPKDIREHIGHCSACKKYYKELANVQQNLSKLSEIKPPKSVLDYYLIDLNRKLKSKEIIPQKTETKSSKHVSSTRWISLRPVFATVLVVVVSLTVWWLGIRTDTTLEPEITDTFDYYNESYAQESVHNPVSTVKGFEYEWAYYRTPKSEK